MKAIQLLLGPILALIVSIEPGLAQSAKPGIERMYNKRAPVQNFNHAQSLATLDRIAAVLREHNAAPRIGHEPSEVPLRKYASAYYE